MTRLLDTNVVSEVRRKHGNRALSAWVNAQPVATMFLSAMTIMEVEIGILRIARRDPMQADRLRYWRDMRLLPDFDGRILAYDVSVARQCAALHVPDPKSDRDAMIAATALVHGLTVVTRNTADFARMGVPLLNPWLPAAQ